MQADIGNYHTEEQVGTIDDDGNLETESGALEAVARPLIEDGIHSIFPYSAEDETGGEAVVYREFHITTDDEGWLREFFDALPSPYDCDMEVLGDLPTFDPDDYLEEKMRKNDFPPWCRSCGERRRMSGSFVCPSCHPDEDEDEYDGDLAGGDAKEKMVEGALQSLVSKERVYIDNPQEAPEGVQVQEGDQGGLWYDSSEAETTGVGEEGSGQGEIDPEIEEYVERVSELGLDVGFDGFDASQAEAVTKALESLDESVLEPVEGITTSPPIGRDEEDQPVAAGSWPSNNIHLHPDRFTQEAVEEKHEEGFLATGTVEGQIAHEVGHIKNYENLDNEGKLDEMAGTDVPPEAEELIEMVISEYATVNKQEFVAECYALKVTKDGIPPKLEEGYEKYGGPEVQE